MASDNVLNENSDVPLPRMSSQFVRKWRLKNKKKDKLLGYEAGFFTDKFHIGLVFYKYAPDIRLVDLKESKRLWFEVLSEKWQFDGNEIPEDHVYKQLKSLSNVVELEKYFKERIQREVKVLTGITVQPLIIGLGEASPYETGITLDFLTGLPIIPGSALKGITRRAAIMKLSGQEDILPYGEEFNELTKTYEKNEDFIKVFGTQDQKGEVVFMDAYPVDWSNAQSNKLFRIDVMNPHYGPYYESKGKNPPADWYNPVPVFYLTVNEGVKYRFVIASKDRNLLKKAYEWLKLALENIGIGAKGNQGYGIFEIDSKGERK